MTRVAPRGDGYAPIEDYAALGDGRSVALVARDGRVDWWPVPTLDSPPVCAALLNPGSGGHFGLAPTEAFEADRHYLEDTNVLETVYRTDSGAVRLTESLNTGAAGRLPWTELARRVEGLAGEVELTWELVPGDRFGQARPWVSSRHRLPMVRVGDQALAVVVHGDGAEPIEVARHHVSGRLRCPAGSRQLVAAVATDNEPLFLPDPTDIDDRIDRTVDAWRRWSRLLARGGPLAEPMTRSALALKTLIFENEGAIAAAATTSLPEKIGGEKNFDYRYAWVRDSSFALDTLIELGLHEEVHRSVSWLLAALRRTAPDLHVFYRLDGGVADELATLDVPGYRGSRPVRVGNSAAGQSQLGVYGDLFDTVARYVDEGHLLDPATGALLAGFADRCCDSWLRPDSSIWELDDLQHYTISKIGCWVALDRASRLAACGQLPDANALRWRAEADDIRAFVAERCWSEAKRSYTFHADTDRLDVAVLLAGRTGFDTGPRLASSVDAVVSELADGACIYRYSGAEEEEGAFLACSFWVVDALCRTGRVDAAGALMDDALGLANDVGLLAEQVDPATGAFLGNFPQALSHLTLVNAAGALRDAEAQPGIG
ncbi:MAG: glycoside hydrolase family 15 protein [Acidimicrobiaceae bacterium]|nr:glycoside hydrolase family 15 protein [Acidimicrobiaceae bacterium]